MLLFYWTTEIKSCFYNFESCPSKKILLDASNLNPKCVVFGSYVDLAVKNKRLREQPTLKARVGDNIDCL